MTLAEFARKNPEHAEEVTERAAIMEFDGGDERGKAELSAIWRVKNKYKMFTQKDLLGGPNG